MLEGPLWADARLERQESPQGLNESRPASWALTIERLENSINDISSKLDRVFPSASPRSPSGLYKVTDILCWQSVIEFNVMKMSCCNMSKLICVDCQKCLPSVL